MTSIASDTSPKSPPVPADPTAPPPIVWHEMHNDPVLDVVLKSSDTPSVYFRASSNALKRESSLFSGMLTSLPNTHQTAIDAIPLDFPASAITVFLDSYMATTRREYHNLPFDIMHELHKLVHYLDCDRLIENVVTAYYDACMADPVSMLVASSRDDDTLRGMVALRYCIYFAQTLDGEAVFPLLSRMAKGWRHALARCLLQEMHSDYLMSSWPSDERIKAFGMSMDAEAKEEGRAVAGVSDDWEWDEGGPGDFGRWTN